MSKTAQRKLAHKQLGMQDANNPTPPPRRIPKQYWSHYRLGLHYGRIRDE